MLLGNTTISKTALMLISLRTTVVATADTPTALRHRAPTVEPTTNLSTMDLLGQEEENEPWAEANRELRRLDRYYRCYNTKPGRRSGDQRCHSGQKCVIYTQHGYCEPAPDARGNTCIPIGDACFDTRAELDEVLEEYFLQSDLFFDEIVPGFGWPMNDCA